MFIDPDAPTIAETELAEALGLDRALLREERALHLSEGSHWLLKKSAIHYSSFGVLELCARLDVPVPTWADVPLPTWAQFDGKKTAKKKDDGGAVAVFVTRRAARNGHIVFAREKDGAAEIPVRVRNALAVGIGDELHVQIVNNLAVLSGPQPRPARRRIAPRAPRPAPAKP